MDIDINDLDCVSRIRVQDDYSTAKHGNVSRVSMEPLNSNVVRDIVLYYDKNGNVYLRLWDISRNVVEIPLIENGGSTVNENVIKLGVVNDGRGGYHV